MVVSRAQESGSPNFERIDPQLPQPWYVAGYSTTALDDVLRMQYGARREAGSVYRVAEGLIRQVYSGDELRGRAIGTLFLLRNPAGRSVPRLDEMLSAAQNMGFVIEPVWTHTD